MLNIFLTNEDTNYSVTDLLTIIKSFTELRLAT